MAGWLFGRLGLEAQSTSLTKTVHYEGEKGSLQGNNS